MAEHNGAPVVLLIDADHWARADTARFLRFAGYCTLEAGDGRAGLRLAREQQPDVVLLELVLPKLSGLEVLVALQAAPARLPVIIVSAYARLIDRRQVAGAHQKPYGALELLRDIERQLPAGRSPAYAAEEVLERLFDQTRPRPGLEMHPLIEEVEQFLRHARGGG
jgi:DNA-binding response OmpR family regulator